MPRSERNNTATGEKLAWNPSKARRSHSVRSSDSEWNLIQRAAVRHGVTAGELVRSNALVGEICRFVYVMATFERDRLLAEKRVGKLDDLVAAARRTMAEAMEEGPV